MANFSALKTAIQNAIKQNGNEEITGDVLQQILLSVVNTMGDGAINTIEQNLSNETLARQNGDNTLQSNINAEALARGNADTQLQNAINAIKADIDNGHVYAGIATPSSTPVSGKVFYVATTAGTYTNFGGQVLTQGINILRFNGSAWSNQQLIGIDDVPIPASNSLIKSGGVQNELALGAVYDVSAKNPTAGPNNDGKWESLSALFSDANLNTLIPTAYRKGGMSIKFVQSFDNKYVQYRLMADEFTTDIHSWYDDYSTVISLEEVEDEIGEKTQEYTLSSSNFCGILADTNGNVAAANASYNGYLIRVYSGQTITLVGGFNKSLFNHLPQIGDARDRAFDGTIQDGEHYLLVTVETASPMVKVTKSDVGIFKELNDINNDIQVIENELSYKTPTSGFIFTNSVADTAIYNAIKSAWFVCSDEEDAAILRSSNKNLYLTYVSNVSGTYGAQFEFFKVPNSLQQEDQVLSYYVAGPKTGTEEIGVGIRSWGKDYLGVTGSVVLHLIVDWDEISSTYSNASVIANVGKINQSKVISEISVKEQVDILSEQADSFERSENFNMLGNLACNLSKNAKAEIKSLDDTVIAIIGDSIWASVGPTELNSNPSMLPPNMVNKNPAYYLYINAVKNKPIWRRYDAPNIFTESASFTTQNDKFLVSSGVHASDAKGLYGAYTRQNNADGANVAFDWDLDDYEKMAFVHRLRYDGAVKVTISVDGGNGKVLVKHNELANPNGTTDGTWVEANGYEFTQYIESASQMYNKADSMANFMTYFKKASGATGSITITFTRTDSDTNKYLYYWGYAMWNGKTIIIDNVARGGISVNQMVGNITNDVKFRHPDIIMLECPIVNTLNYMWGSASSRTTLKNKFEAFLFNTGPEKDGTATGGASFTTGNLSQWADNDMIVYLVGNCFSTYFEANSSTFKKNAPTSYEGNAHLFNGNDLFNAVKELLVDKEKEYIDYFNFSLTYAEDKGINYTDLYSNATPQAICVDIVHPNKLGAMLQGRCVADVFIK